MTIGERNKIDRKFRKLLRVAKRIRKFPPTKRLGEYLTDRIFDAWWATE